MPQANYQVIRMSKTHGFHFASWPPCRWIFKRSMVQPVLTLELVLRNAQRRPLREEEVLECIRECSWRRVLGLKPDIRSEDHRVIVGPPLMLLPPASAEVHGVVPLTHIAFRIVKRPPCSVAKSEPPQVSVLCFQQLVQSEVILITHGEIRDGPIPNRREAAAISSVKMIIGDSEITKPRVLFNHVLAPGIKAPCISRRDSGLAPASFPQPRWHRCQPCHMSCLLERYMSHRRVHRSAKRLRNLFPPQRSSSLSQQHSQRKSAGRQACCKQREWTDVHEPVTRKNQHCVTRVLPLQGPSTAQLLPCSPRSQGHTLDPSPVLRYRSIANANSRHCIVCNVPGDLQVDDKVCKVGHWIINEPLAGMVQKLSRSRCMPVAFGQSVVVHRRPGVHKRQLGHNAGQ
mmetsp:Transcript_24855/g.63404  ORF Transcript_24855/g.63404 Transcript_24855/m.63404 type:complete len:401 (-) Transcript_24855:768-1970(-)